MRILRPDGFTKLSGRFAVFHPRGRAPNVDAQAGQMVLV
jgi:hypothetical protein